MPRVVGAAMPRVVGAAGRPEPEGRAVSSGDHERLLRTAPWPTGDPPAGPSPHGRARALGPPARPGPVRHHRRTGGRRARSGRHRADRFRVERRARALAGPLRRRGGAPGGRSRRPLRGGGRGEGGPHGALRPRAHPPGRGRVPRRPARARRGRRRGRAPGGRGGGRPRPGDRDRGHRALPDADDRHPHGDDAGRRHPSGPSAGAGQPRRGGPGLRCGPGRTRGRRRVPRGVVGGPGPPRGERPPGPGVSRSGSSTSSGETVWGATARTLVELLCIVLGVASPSSSTRG